MHSIKETEQAILGAILLDNNLMTAAAGQGIKSEMFTAASHKELFKIYKMLYNNKTVIDIATITAIADDITRLGGIGYITSLSGGVATLRGFNDYLDILVKEYQKQSLKQIGAFLQSDQGNEPEETIAALQTKTLEILKLSAHEGQDKETRYSKHIENKYKIKFGEIQAGYKSGFKYLDEKLAGGFKKGNYITVVSGSGVGKTTFSINIAYNMALRGIKTAFYSVEMTETELLDKITAAALEIDYGNISTAQLDQQEFQKIEVFLNGLLNLPLDIVQDATTTEDLLNSIMYKVLSEGVEVFFIDYLQLYCTTSSGNTLSEKLGDLTINLKKLAQRNNITIIALAQANRLFKTRIREDEAETYLLTESDIQDSGRILQNSNIVLGITRNTLLDDKDRRIGLQEKCLLNYNSLDITVNPELMIVQIMKNRGGSIGKVALRFQGQFSKVANFR